MKHNKSIIQKITASREAIYDSLQKIPVVEIAGDRRVLIENHVGVMEYGDKRIGVRIAYGQLFVCGSDLQLVQITKEQLVILGRIDQVNLHREGDVWT